MAKRKTPRPKQKIASTPQSDDGFIPLSSGVSVRFGGEEETGDVGDRGKNPEATVDSPDPALSAPVEEPEQQTAGLVKPIVEGIKRGFRKGVEGADEIARQRAGPSAKPATLVGDPDKPLVEILEDTTPQQFLD